MVTGLKAGEKYRFCLRYYFFSMDMPVDLKRLLYFCTIVEQGQISRAARVLNMAQPPLSQRLRELEEEIGYKLFLRSRRGLQVTEAGRLLYRRARAILHSVDEARDEVIRAASQSGPALRVGVSPTCRHLWISRFPEFVGHFSGHVVGLVVGDSSYLEQLLQAGNLDMALMQPPLQPENFVVHKISSSKSVAVAPQGLLPADMRPVSLAELARHRLLLLRRSVGTGSYERLLQLFHEAQLRSDIVLYSSDVDSLLVLLKEGFAGIAVVPESEVASNGERFDVRPIAVALPSYHLSLVFRRIDADELLHERLLAFWKG